MKQLDYYRSDDYAGFQSGKYDFYFGYEETEGDEWCFVVKENKKPIFKRTGSEIEKCFDSMVFDEPRDYLICGIALYKLLM